MSKGKKVKHPKLIYFVRNKLVYIIGFLVFILAIVQLIISHHLATAGGVLRQMEKKAAQLEQENKSLREEISKVGSLSKISSQAGELGLVRTTQVLHLTPQIPVALK